MLFKITNCQGNAIQNHSEVSVHTGWTDYHQKEITNTGEDVEKREPLCSAGGNGNWYNHSRKQFMETAQNIKNKKLPYDPAILLFDIYLKNTEILIQKDICSPMFTAALVTVAKIWRRPECHG